MNVQEQILQSKQQQEQLKRDKKQDRHRALNSFIILAILWCSIYAAYTVYDKFDAVDETVAEVASRFDQLSYDEHKTNELAQIVQDEGYKRCVYNDSRGLQTIGFGHLMLPTDTFKCITPQEAVELLYADYSYAENSVDTKYPWATGETRLVLINMTYQMGQTGVSKFKKALQCLKESRYMCATIELLSSRWATQTSSRASRLAGRVLAISVSQSDAG
jgi:lysozyme